MAEKPRAAPAFVPSPPAPPPPAAQADEIVTTASRRSESVRDRAQLAEGRSEIVVTAAKRESIRRGDWNACTVDDPARSLANCRRQASGQIADGLSLAWEGDTDGAIAAFDQAITRSPRSSAAYLNRGLAHRRNGDSDQALSDLDKAVRYAPEAARAYYSRSLVLRDRGENRRADADQNRAILLDPRYATVSR
jgi:tetratricopeptide (TPR) repeat protein